MGIQVFSKEEGIQHLLQQADEDVNIYNGSVHHIASHHLPVTLKTPGDYVSWMLHDADMHRKMAEEETESDDDKMGYKITCDLLTRHAIQLIQLGVYPTPIDWKTLEREEKEKENEELCHQNASSNKEK